MTITSPWGWGTAAPVMSCNVHKQSPNSYCWKKTVQTAGSFRALKTLINISSNTTPAIPNMEEVKMQTIHPSPTRFSMQAWTTRATPLTSAHLS